MQNLIIDSRIRNEEIQYLSKYFNIIKLPLSDDVYEEISGHSDIFYCNINNKIISAPNSTFKDNQFVIGQLPVKRNYPDDVLYNVCQIGKSIIGSKYVDNTIKPNTFVKQGYVKCSICVTSDNSCITTDRGIEKILKNKKIDVLFIEENDIKLLKKDKSISKMKGFIGGATLVYNNKFILFGDSSKLSNKNKILEHLKKYKLELVDFKGLDVYDYGGGIIF